MNVIQSADVNKLANIIRRIANEQEQGLWEFRFKGKPEGSPAATRYPNLLAEGRCKRLFAGERRRRREHRLSRIRRRD